MCQTLFTLFLQYFELVIFTDEPNSYADPIINRLDTYKVGLFSVPKQAGTHSVPKQAPQCERNGRCHALHCKPMMQCKGKMSASLSLM